MPTAVITGIPGQAGSYLAELLLAKGYRIVGMMGRASTENFERVAHLRDRIELRQADLLDQLSLIDLLRAVEPDEIYNLAAQSFVPTSWQQPVLTAEFDAVGVTRLLEAIRLVAPEARFYQASSSEMFGRVRETPQRETTPFYPRSPYGVAKVYGHFITVNYRESYGLYACSGILFNHECIVASTPLMAGDGYIGKESAHVQFTNNGHGFRARVTELWSRLFLGTAREWEAPSGFDRERRVKQLALTGAPQVAGWLRSQLYTATGHKQVPPLVLNADDWAQQAFLAAYYAGDGLKAGNGDSVKTNSPVLAQGLCWLYTLRGQQSSVYVEWRDDTPYYQVNLSSSRPQGLKGQHLRKNPAEVRRVVPRRAAEGEWVFDLETESGTFCAGVGGLVVHNSPRRGREFVTRKVSDGAVRVKLGLAPELRLGNLEARRDWGFAGDHVEAMWRMLQQPTADDYVVATGESHSVRELVEVAFGCVGLDWRQHVREDPALLRPAEVEHLVGDGSKARRVLGWAPRVSFRELVEMMVRADLDRLQRT